MDTYEKASKYQQLVIAKEFGHPHSRSSENTNDIVK